MEKSHIWMIIQGSVYHDSGQIECIAHTKRIAETKCKDDGFRYSKTDKLWLGWINGREYWREIEKIDYYYNEDRRNGGEEGFRQEQDAFVKQQKRLPPDMEKLLHDNAWELNID